MLDAFADRLAAAGNAKAVTLTSGLGSIGDVGSGYGVMYRASKAAVNMAMIDRAVSSLRAASPWGDQPGLGPDHMSGAGAAISPEESVAAMRRIIDGLGPEQTGTFLNWRGGRYPW